MSAVTGRTHVNWRYRTLKARRDSTMRCMARLTATKDLNTLGGPTTLMGERVVVVK